jgi:multisubunit Na+/H+ antiporter MnhB subunit
MARKTHPDHPIPVVDDRKALKILLVVPLSALFGGLGYAVLSLPVQAPGLSDRVAEALKTSGVSNPVTAVLLNFRGYDTLLEMGVLLLALLGVWSLAGSSRGRNTAAGPVLDTLVRLLVPVLILVAGYLLWVGSHAPGGAFQAGSVLGAAGVLLLLAGWRLGARFAGLALRIVLVAGLGMFIAVGLASIPVGGRWLEYPAALAGSLILIIEAAATLSIGVTLAALFLGGQTNPGARE